MATKNGTASFVSFLGRQFAVTCRHVMEATSNPQVIAGARNPTPALQVGKIFINLSFFTAAGLQNALRTPDPEHGEPQVDVAIAELTGAQWELLSSRKAKKAIDLDNWREPNWATVKMCAAAGYPDEHKEFRTVANEEMVAAPMVLAAAEVAGRIAKDQRIITLLSRLDELHGYFFSGVSGGTLYTAEDDGLVPAGIVFEGYPSTKDEQRDRANTPAFLDEYDIFIRALTLTPEVFQEWLHHAKLTV